MSIDLPDRELLDAAPDAMIVVDDRGDIRLVNRQAEAMFGYTREELLGESVDILVPDRSRDEHADHRNAFTQSIDQRPMGQGMELYGRHRNGDEIPVEISLSPIDTADGRFVVSAIRDVSYQRQIANEIKSARQSAEDATRLKSRFLAAASHDLRQPLQSLGLYLSVVQRQIDKGVSVDDIVDVTHKMRTSLEVMGELLDTLLDISRFDAGTVEADISVSPLQAIFDRLSADCGPHANEKGLNLEFAPSTYSVMTDAGMLQRIIENFVSNAIRYTEAGSVTVRANRNGDEIRIDVTDTGIGIPNTHLEDIFNEYVQLDNDVRDRRKGVGLGLAIVKHIANLLEHRLEVKSVEGEGSTFSVYVPLVEDALNLNDSGTTSSVSSLDHITVLFVEDDPDVAEATQMLLEMAGIETHHYADGEQAIAAIRDESFRADLIVSDYRLSGDNGIDVVRKVREIVGFTIPAIMITGDTSSSEIDQAGLTDSVVMRKPIDGDKLITLINDMLET